MLVMVGQSVPHLKRNGVVDHHGGVLPARRKSSAVMRELEKPDLSSVDTQLKNISQRELVPVTYMIGKE